MPASPRVLEELQYGPSCFEEGSHIKGFGACAGGWPGHSIPLLLRQAGPKGAEKEAAENIQVHIAEVFPEWISHSGHFVATLLPLAEGWS